jgi:sensor histidine kinase YesM
MERRESIISKLPLPYAYFILAGIAMGTLLGAKYYFSFLLWGEKFVWHRYFFPQFINQTLWGLLVPLIYFYFLKYPLRDGQIKHNRVKALFASIGVALLHEVLSLVIWFVPLILLGTLEWSQKESNYIIGALPAGFVNQWIEYWLIYGFLMAIDYAKKYRVKQVELANIQTQLSDAKLNALKRQLQPHFLFNTLNTISSLMEINIKDAQKIVSKLGGLLRGVLDRDERNMIPLREEIAFIKNYLGIEQVRFHDRLSIVYAVEDSTLDALVPSLILQPLVENAVKHGFANQIEKGVISVITKKIANNRVQMIVKDDGNGVELPIKNVEKKGIGLQNVKNRLALIYKENYSLSIDSYTNQGFEVSIILPFSN